MNRVFQIAVLGLVGLIAFGCEGQRSETGLENVKIGNIAPSRRDNPRIGPLKTANIEVHIYELPAENMAKLDDVWESLYTGGIRFYNYRAFSENLFRVGMGRRFRWSKVGDLLTAAGGRRMAKISLLLPRDQPQDVTVMRLRRRRELSYFGRDMSREREVIGPGVMGLRMQAWQIAGQRGVSQVVAYPVFTIPRTSTIEPFVERARSWDVKFTSAGFGLKMSPDDFVVLGPRKYLSENVTLPGLFFSNLDGAVFLEKGRLPQRKPSVRVFVFVCTGIGY